MRKIMHKHCNCTNAVYGMITLYVPNNKIHNERKKENIIIDKRNNWVSSYTPY